MTFSLIDFTLGYGVGIASAMVLIGIVALRANLNNNYNPRKGDWL